MSLILATAAIGSAILGAVNAQSPGQKIAAFADGACDYATGNYSYFSLGEGYPACGRQYFSGLGFPQVGSDYNVTFDLPVPGNDCKILLRAPSNVDDQFCGEVVTQVVNGGCHSVVLPEPFDLNFCCGVDECNAAIKRKRSLGESEYTYIGKSAATAKREALTKRDGTWSGTEIRSRSGDAQQVSNTQNCGANGGENGVEISVSTGSTKSWNIGGSASVTLFGIVSVGAMGGAEFAEEETKTVTTSVSYTCSPGTSGYISWAPTLLCSVGEFSSDCTVEGMACPTGEQTACVPDKTDAGLPLGTVNWVEII